MTAAKLLSQLVSPVLTSDTGEEVLTMMGVYHLRHLPIVNNEQLLGVISEDDILSQDVDAAIGSYSLSMRRPFVELDTNIIDIMGLMAEYNLSVVPVVDDQQNFKGMVVMEDLVQYFSQSATFHQPGSVIVLHMDQQDYSLVEISRIIESEGALILGLFIYDHESPNTIRVTIKLNKKMINPILAALERYDYKVEARFTEEDIFEDLQDRYDSFMKYLNV